MISLTGSFEGTLTRLSLIFNQENWLFYIFSSIQFFGRKNYIAGDHFFNWVLHLEMRINVCRLPPNSFPRTSRIRYFLKKKQSYYFFHQILPHKTQFSITIFLSKLYNLFDSWYLSQRQVSHSDNWKWSIYAHKWIYMTRTQILTVIPVSSPDTRLLPFMKFQKTIFVILTPLIIEQSLIWEWNPLSPWKSRFNVREYHIYIINLFWIQLYWMEFLFPN